MPEKRKRWTKQAVRREVYRRMAGERMLIVGVVTTSSRGWTVTLSDMTPTAFTSAGATRKRAPDAIDAAIRGWGAMMEEKSDG